MRNSFYIKNKPVKVSSEDYKISGSYTKNKDLLVYDKLKESEKRYRRLFESAKDGILILDFETGNIVDANPFIINIIDRPLKEIIGKKLWEIGLFSNKEQSEFAVIELKAKGYIRYEDMPIQRQNGKITEVEFVCNVYLVNNIKVIQCNIRDITERKQTEKTLIVSESRYRRLFETAQDGILILEFETGNITDANPFIIKIIDSPLKEILGKKLWEIGLFSNKEESERAFNELKTNGYIRFEDMPIQRPNGKIIEVEFVSNVYLVNDKKVIQCNIRDITDRKNIEKALTASDQILKKQNTDYLNLNEEYLKLNEELTMSIIRIQNMNDELIHSKVKAEESDNLKSAFLANMSHEIRTPMNAIMGFSGFLLEPGLTKEKIEEFVQIINVSSLQLLSVISDIIDISKIESGQIVIDSELVNINHLMNELFVTYKKLVELKKLSLYYSNESDSKLDQIKTDGNRIKQIFCNLINNAIKFTTEGKIEFGFKIKGNFIEFYVKDTGIGIAPENQKMIFQRFRQVETTNGRVYSGNGLGLSISSALVEKLGGTIEVNSELGKGSTFIFTIPYVTEIKNTVTSKLPIESNKYNWRGKTILLVEDEVNNHAYAEEILLVTDAKIIHAWDGKQAVEQVKNHSEISLVLMDIKLPLMNGYEATHLIKQMRPKLPVVAQTGYALANNRKQALEAGCDNYLAKPVDKDVLLKVINNYL
jgi:PAS domain S-box-containing protein